MAGILLFFEALQRSGSPMPHSGMNDRSKDALLFFAQVVLLTCLLGIAIDLVTANVAVEYFTVHHPHVVDSTSPWVMALVWGVAAAWWFGLIAAALLWWMNVRRVSPLPRPRIVRMIVPALIAIWVIMMGILVGVYAIASLVPDSRRGPTFEHDRRLMAVALAHAGEYVLGGIAVIVLMMRVARVKG